MIFIEEKTLYVQTLLSIMQFISGATLSLNKITTKDILLVMKYIFQEFHNLDWLQPHKNIMPKMFLKFLKLFHMYVAYTAVPRKALKNLFTFIIFGYRHVIQITEMFLIS